MTKMLIDRPVVEQALEAYSGGPNWRGFADAMDALRAALAEDAMQKFTDVNQELEAALAKPMQEPVAWLWRHRETGRTRLLMPNERTATDVAAAFDVVGPLYLAPPQRKPLTEEEIRDLWSWAMTAEAERTATTQQHAFARAIERAHGIV